MFNIQKMMKQAQEMQFKMQELQEKFREIMVHGESGNGAVKVEMMCSGETKSIKIDPSLVSGGDVEMVEDLVLAAINNAGMAKEAKIAEETKALMAESGLPADMAGKLPF